MPSTIRILADKEAIFRAAANEFTCLAEDAIEARGKFSVALSGGSTPRGLFELLTTDAYKKQVDWTRVEFFWGDERSVPPDDKDSNYGMARETLLAPLAIPDTQIHRIQAERADREQAAKDYEAEIGKLFGVKQDGSAPAFDLILLGMGPCGHTASLFPHTTALKESRRWVVVNHVPKFDTDRFTFTPRLLNGAVNVLFLVSGADKADALAAVLQGKPNPEEYPSQLIKPAGNLVWLIDKAAGAQLKKRT